MAKTKRKALKLRRLAIAGVGAALEYLFDPVQGGRRRKELWERARPLVDKARPFLDKLPLADKLPGKSAPHPEGAGDRSRRNEPADHASRSPGDGASGIAGPPAPDSRPRIVAPR
jgi:hypothetical protein